MAKFNDVTMGQMEACINRMGGMQNFLTYIRGEGKIVFDTLLTFIGTMKMGAQLAFVTSPASFSEYLSDIHHSNVIREFCGLEVAAAPAVELALHKVDYGADHSPNGRILLELGKKAEVGIAHFVAFLSDNRGTTDRFIFYLRGKNGNLWAVYARWEMGGESDFWYVQAYPADKGHSQQYAGAIVVSRA
jgi:hypothetical protein